MTQEQYDKYTELKDRFKKVKDMLSDILEWESRNDKTSLTVYLYHKEGMYGGSYNFDIHNAELQNELLHAIKAHADKVLHELAQQMEDL